MSPAPAAVSATQDAVFVIQDAVFNVRDVASLSRHPVFHSGTTPAEPPRHRQPTTETARPNHTTVRLS
ncbi:hypothetical protein AmyhaDRAFT_0326 [Haloechinothrix halophila YIM 93223]|uniref:Uncharacterized protein n=1 Tax=Haloechinothrix halophila YIM 93223 TaxID=592678 RepID=W9DT40_9PSEU|nr:hypothetical protein AmyhaDRAFT_0326 [Haloechinothrix halophila YIM 93223]